MLMAQVALSARTHASQKLAGATMAATATSVTKATITTKTRTASASPASLALQQQALALVSRSPIVVLRLGMDMGSQHTTTAPSWNAQLVSILLTAVPGACML